jgi:hypothetical protein
MFISTDLETLLPYSDKLSADTKPTWGTMTAQRMVEHLTDTLKIATGETPFPLEVPEDRLERMLAFLESDKPMAPNLKVAFVQDNTPIRHSEIELAVDEYVETWLDLEMLYANNPGLKHPHPYYGPLDFDQWNRLHSKHLTHHFTQFGLL